MKKGLYHILFFVLLLQQATAQPVPPPDFFMQHFTKDQGLTVPNPYKLVKDRRGILWIAGFEGLNSFDGHSFTAYTTKSGLGANAVYDVRMDTAGIIYATTAETLCRYTGVTGAPFSPLPLPVHLQDMSLIVPVSSNYIYVSDDATQSLYLLSNNSLVKIAGVHGIMQQMEIDRNGYLYVYNNSNEIYVVHDKMVMDSVTVPLLAPPGQQAEFIYRMERDAAGNVYLNANTSRLLIPRQPILSDSGGLASSYTYSIKHNPNNYVYQRTDTGMKKLFRLPNTNGSPNSYLLPDKDNRFWFVAGGQGLTLFYPAIPRPWKATTGYSYYFTGSNGRPIYSGDATLAGNALARRHYDQLRNVLYSVHVGRDHTVWYCCKAGVYYLPQGHGPLLHYTMPREKNTAQAVFLNALEDRKGNTWFKALGGIARYSNGHFRYWDRKDGLIDDAFYTHAVDSNDIYYAAGNSLYAWVTDTPVNVSARLGMGRGIIFASCTDNKGSLWMSPSASYIVRITYDKRTGFSATDRLPTRINGHDILPVNMVFDHAGNMWVTSDNYIVAYLLQKDGGFLDTDKIVLASDQHIGEYAGPFRVDAAMQKLYLAGAVLDTDSIIAGYHKKAPAVYFTGIRLHQQDPDWRTFGKVDIYGIPASPTLAYNQNALSFYFTAIVPGDQPEVVYQYKLNGLDDEWNAVTYTAQAHYTNLSPGHYTFLVKAANVNGVWSAPVIFPFTITPPWYLTVTAYIVWSVLLIACCALLFMLRINFIKKRERAKRMTVEHQLRALQAQINPHFLQNTFEFLSQSLREQPVDSTQSVIRQLSSYLRNVLYRSDDVIVTMEDELLFAEEYLAINKLLFHNNFTYTISIDDNLDTFALKLPSMILQPILENAIKHGVRYTASNQAVISITAAAHGEYASCAITNTIAGDAGTAGVALPEGYRPKGIVITQQRLNLLYRRKKKATISAAAKDGLYTVTINFPL